MTIENFFTTVLSSMTMGAALVCVGFIFRGCINDARWPSHAIALAYFFVVMTVEAFDLMAQHAPDPLRIPWFRHLTVVLVPSLGACIWFYVRSLTSQNANFKRRDILHFIPIVICIIGALPYLTLPEDRQAAIMSTDADLLDPKNLVPVLFLLLAWVTWIAILILYGGASMSRLIKHRRRIRDLYSRVDGISLIWLHSLIIAVVTFTVLVLAYSIFPAVGDADLFSRNVVAFFYLAVVFTVGLFGVLQKGTIPSWNELETAAQPSGRYARSALTGVDLTRIAEKLDAAMLGAKMWKDPNLTLLDMTNATSVSQNNISQTLNSYLGVNFYEYVNRWRIKAACEALRGTDQSVLAISEDVGFNAKSTFNAAFKKIVGQTPRQYRAAQEVTGMEPKKRYGRAGPVD